MKIKVGSCVIVDDYYIVKVTRIEDDKFWGPYVCIHSFDSIHHVGLFVDSGANTKIITEKPIYYPSGTRFTIDGTEHILANVGKHSFCFIGLTSGNRWRDPVDFGYSPYGLTFDQLKQLGNVNMNPL